MLAETARPLLAELVFKMQTQLLRPRTVVRYSRVPFIYAPGNVRVTFDCNLCQQTRSSTMRRSRCAAARRGAASFSRSNTTNSCRT